MNEIKSGYSHRSEIVERLVPGQTVGLALDTPDKELRKKLVFVKTYSKLFAIFDSEETKRALYNCSELGICPHVYKFSTKELVTEFIDSRPTEEEILVLNHVDLLAKYHAANHRDFMDYRTDSNHMPFCRMIHELLAMCKQNCPDDYRRMSESMKPRDFDHELQTLCPQYCSTKECNKHLLCVNHGDFNKNNILCAKGGDRKFIIDFDSAHVNYWYYDIIYAIGFDADFFSNWRRIPNRQDLQLIFSRYFETLAAKKCSLSRHVKFEQLVDNFHLAMKLCTLQQIIYNIILINNSASGGSASIIDFEAYTLSKIEFYGQIEQMMVD